MSSADQSLIPDQRHEKQVNVGNTQPLGLNIKKNILTDTENVRLLTQMDSTKERTVTILVVVCVSRKLLLEDIMVPAKLIRQD